MQNLSPLAVGLIVAAVTASFAAIGWMINSQNQTNKSLAQGVADLSKGITSVVVEFKAAMLLIEERSNNQKTLCQMYRDQINSNQKKLEIQVNKIETKNHKS